MSGNVWEWCLNEHDHPQRTGLSGTARRVVRGGSWLNGQVHARAPFLTFTTCATVCPVQAGAVPRYQRNAHD